MSDFRIEVPVDEELEATFGPQWSAVVGIVRRAAALTVDEVSALGDARAVGIAARVTARVAAWRAARGSDRGDTWGAAWRAAWDAAQGDVAAGDAAWGVACHDLIGDTFTAAHYQALVGPWESVFGDPLAYTGEAV